MKLLALLAFALLIAALFAAPAPLSAQDEKSKDKADDKASDAVTDAAADTPSDATADVAVKDKAVDAIDKFIAEAKKTDKIDVQYPHWGTNLPKPPKVEFDPKHDYFWVLDTNKGVIRIKLMPGTLFDRIWPRSLVIFVCCSSAAWSISVTDPANVSRSVGNRDPVTTISSSPSPSSSLSAPSCARAMLNKAPAPKAIAAPTESLKALDTNIALPPRGLLIADFGCVPKM